MSELFYRKDGVLERKKLSRFSHQVTLLELISAVDRMRTVNFYPTDMPGCEDFSTTVNVDELQISNCYWSNWKLSSPILLKITAWKIDAIIESLFKVHLRSLLRSRERNIKEPVVFIFSNYKLADCYVDTKPCILKSTLPGRIADNWQVPWKRYWK